MGEGPGKSALVDADAILNHLKLCGHARSETGAGAFGAGLRAIALSGSFSVSLDMRRSLRIR